MRRFAQKEFANRRSIRDDDRVDVERDPGLRETIVHWRESTANRTERIHDNAVEDQPRVLDAEDWVDLSEKLKWPVQVTRVFYEEVGRYRPCMWCRGTGVLFHER